MVRVPRNIVVEAEVVGAVGPIPVKEAQMERAFRRRERRDPGEVVRRPQNRLKAVARQRHAAGDFGVLDAVERERLEGRVLRSQDGPEHRRLFYRDRRIGAVGQRNEDHRPIAAATFVRGSGKDFFRASRFNR